MVGSSVGVKSCIGTGVVITVIGCDGVMVESMLCVVGFVKTTTVVGDGIGRDVGSFKGAGVIVKGELVE